MSSEETDLSRRHMLAVLGTGAMSSTAGCSGDSDDDEHEDGDDTSPSDEDDTPGDGEDTSQNGDGSPTPENEPPEVLDYEVEPADFGTRLLVSLAGEDTRGIERAAISYGDLCIAETPEDTSVSVEGELADIHEADIEETPGAVVFELEDVEGERTEESVQPHRSSPGLSVDTVTTATPGELVVEIEADDQIGLHWLQIAANGEPIEKIDVTGSDETVHELSTDADAISDGEMNEVTTTVRNTFGGETRLTEQAYVRQYEQLEVHNFDIAATVVPIAYREYEESWEECTDARPAGGTYDLGDLEAINRQVDQMQGFGINRYQYDFRAPDAVGPFEEHIGDGMLQEIDFEVLWPIGNPFGWYLGMDDWTAKQIVDWCLAYIRDEFLTLSNYGTQDGRPVITIHDFRSLTWNDSYAEAIEAEWGSFDALTAYLKDELTINGTEPYVIAGAKQFGQGYREGHASEDDIELLEPADGVTHWTGLVRDHETVTQDEHKEFHEQNMEGLVAFAEDYNMEFIPSVTPGFNELHSECFPGSNPERHVPRSPDYFNELLDLADEYRTTDRIHISSYNDWNEGHQIEPGTFNGSEYGVAYLEKIKEFVEGVDK